MNFLELGRVFGSIIAAVRTQVRLKRKRQFASRSMQSSVTIFSLTIFSLGAILLLTVSCSNSNKSQKPILPKPVSPAPIFPEEKIKPNPVEPVQSKPLAQFNLSKMTVQSHKFMAADNNSASNDPTEASSSGTLTNDTAPAEANPAPSNGAAAAAAAAAPKEAANPPVLASAANDKRVLVAILLPLSGRDSAIGTALLNAAMMAVYDFGDQRLVLMPFDTETSGGAKSAALAAIDAGAAVILGPVYGRQVAEVAAVAASRSINVISFSNDESVAGNNAFTFGFSPRQSLNRVLEYAYSRGVTSYAALLEDDSFGRSLADQMRNTVNAMRGSIVRIDLYDTATTDFTSAVQAVTQFESRRVKGNEPIVAPPLLPGQTAPVQFRSKDAQKRAAKLATMRSVDYQALVLNEYGRRLRNLASLIPYYDVDTTKVRILGATNGFEDLSLAVEPALVGAWFSAPEPANRSKFEKAYQQYFLKDQKNKYPLRLATMSYDLVGLAALLARQGDNGDFSTTMLRNPEGFIGIDGIFRFNLNNVAERGLAVLEIGRTEYKVLNKAPTSFIPKKRS